MTTKNIVISGVKHPIENLNLRNVVFERHGMNIGAIKYDVSKERDKKEFQNLCILAGIEFDESELKGTAMRAILSEGKIKAIGHRKFDMFILADDGEEIRTEERCKEKLSN